MINKIIISCLLTCFSFEFLFAVGDNPPVGGRSAAMANASVTLSDLWSVNYNQAGLAEIKNFSAGIYYENRFAIKNLGLKSGTLAIPVKSGVFGLSITQFGYSLYNENKIGLAYAKTFGDKFSAGVQLDYLSTHIAESYGNSSAIAAELGIRYQLVENLYIGAHIFNPSRAKLADYNDERIPTIAKLGLSYVISEKLIIAIESEKDIEYDNILKAGIEYHPVKQFYFRTGVSTNPVLNAFGVGIEFNNFNLDFSASYHRTLGFTPQFSLIFHTSKNSQPPVI